MFYQIIKLTDDFLNRITMYRLVLYYLIGLLIIAFTFGYISWLPYDPWSIVFSSLFLVFFCGFVNEIFSRVYKAPTNIESVYISALILALIITPPKTLSDFIFLGWAGTWAMASKYIFNIKGKHLFNPVGIAVALTAFGISQSASWWVGNLSMLPFVALGGFLIARKTRREDMVFVFLVIALATVTGFSLIKGSDLINIWNKFLFHSSLFFFAFVMLTEPLTMPPTKNLQLFYAGLAGFLFVPDIHLVGIYSTPELSLLIGNLFSYIVSPKEKLVLKLKEKLLIAPDTYDFLFPLRRKLAFSPGQYMEWTLPHKNPDARGNRRYFTLASSPTEDNLRIGVKFYENSSSFKKKMLNIDEKSPIVVSQRAGDFTLPKDKNKKLVFIAGGIGITPFRSMIKYLIDIDEKRDIILFYSNREKSEIVYNDIFMQADKKLGIKTIYTLTDKNNIPDGWQGETGRISKEMIERNISDYRERFFYLSGPHGLVTAFENVLNEMGINSGNIKTDFFPGFA